MTIVYYKRDVLSPSRVSYFAQSRPTRRSIFLSNGWSSMVVAPVGNMPPISETVYSGGVIHEYGIIVYALARLAIKDLEVYNAFFSYIFKEGVDSSLGDAYIYIDIQYVQNIDLSKMWPCPWVMESTINTLDLIIKKPEGVDTMCIPTGSVRCAALFAGECPVNLWKYVVASIAELSGCVPKWVGIYRKPVLDDRKHMSEREMVMLHTRDDRERKMERMMNKLGFNLI